MANMVESSIAKYDRQVEVYESRYGKRFEALAKSSIFKGSLGKQDIYNLGRQFDKFKKYEQACHEDSSAASLGSLPRVALDLISAAYGLSVAPQLTSVQDMDEAQGLIYYKKTFTHGYPLTATNGLQALPENRWMDADGKLEGEATFNGAWKKWHDHRAAQVADKDTNLPSKDMAAKNFDAVTTNAFKGWVSSPAAYVSERQVEAITSTETTLKNIVGNTRWNVPMNIRLVSSTGEIQDVVGICAGPGQLPTFYGKVQVSATANNGDLVLTTPAGYTGLVSYDIDFEKAPNIPAIEYSLESQVVTAEIMGVKEMMGTFKSYQFNKRFGRAAQDEVLNDLSGHLAMAESEKIIGAYVECANKWAPVTWDIGRPGGVSEFEHRQSLLYAIQAASAAIASRAGKGYGNKIICGYVAGQYIQSLPGFRAAPQTNLVGPAVFGTLDNEGITVIRSNTIVAPNEIIVAYASDNSPFEAPVVCATYMPVFVTETLPSGLNPFQNQRAIASWKAITPVVSEFVQRIVLTKSTVQADVNVYLGATVPAVGGGEGN